MLDDPCALTALVSPNGPEQPPPTPMGPGSLFRLRAGPPPLWELCQRTAVLQIATALPILGHRALWYRSQRVSWLPRWTSPQCYCYCFIWQSLDLIQLRPRHLVPGFALNPPLHRDIPCMLGWTWPASPCLSCLGAVKLQPGWCRPCPATSVTPLLRDTWSQACFTADLLQRHMQCRQMFSPLNVFVVPVKCLFHLTVQMSEEQTPTIY